MSDCDRRSPTCDRQMLTEHLLGLVDSSNVDRKQCMRRVITTELCHGLQVCADAAAQRQDLERVRSP